MEPPNAANFTGSGAACLPGDGARQSSTAAPRPMLRPRSTLAAWIDRALTGQSTDAPSAERRWFGIPRCRRGVATTAWAEASRRFSRRSRKPPPAAAARNGEHRCDRRNPSQCPLTESADKAVAATATCLAPGYAGSRRLSRRSWRGPLPLRRGENGPLALASSLMGELNRWATSLRVRTREPGGFAQITPPAASNRSTRSGLPSGWRAGGCRRPPASPPAPNGCIPAQVRLVPIGSLPRQTTAAAPRPSDHASRGRPSL